MNYDHELQRIITAIKADKGIVQPWRNKALARLQEVQAFIHEGQHTSNLKPPEGTELTSYGTAKLPNVLEGRECICPAGGIHRRCPVHGELPS